MKKVLRAKTISIDNVSSGMEARFFELFQTCYQNVNRDNFLKDLRAKEKVIILFDSNNIIQGFSTLKSFTLVHENKKYSFLFSGDTVIHPDYWGTSALTMEFLKNIIKEKLKYPFRPVYWYLMTKGYKTYLLLANNFVTYYPNYEKRTPKLIDELLALSSEFLYPGLFNPKTGLLIFENHETLKDEVAPISEKQLGYPKINFFVEKNPNWAAGEELACLGEVEFKLLFVHPFKVLRKTVCKKLNIKYETNKPRNIKA